MALLRKTLLLTAAFSAATMLTACGGASHTQGVTKAGVAKSGFMGLSTTADITQTTPAAFKGLQKVVIGTFTVGFDTMSTDSNKAGGGLLGSGFGGKSTAKSELKGIDGATMQAITDSAYADFVNRLKAAGYEVVDRSTLLGSDFAKATSYENPYVAANNTLLSKVASTTYYAPSSFPRQYSLQGDIGGVTGGFAFANGGMAAANFAQAEGGVPVLSASYRLDFANAEGHGSWASSTSSVQVGQGLSVMAGSKLGVIKGQAGSFSTNIGNVALGQPISSEKAFATVEDATTGTDKTLQVATNVIGAIGGIGTNSKRYYNFNAKPADYKSAALDILKQANTALIGKMQSLR